MLLLHWIEMNTKWTEKWTKTEHRGKKSQDHGFSYSQENQFQIV